MSNEKDIIFSPVKLQKQGNYYKIAVPPDLIEKEIIDTTALYEVRLRKIK